MRIGFTIELYRIELQYSFKHSYFSVLSGSMTVDAIGAMKLKCIIVIIAIVVAIPDEFYFSPDIYLKDHFCNNNNINNI